MNKDKCLTCDLPPTTGLGEKTINGGRAIVYLHWGYCSKCWTNLTDEQREVLTGEKRKTKVIEHRTVVYPTISAFRRWGTRAWRLVVSAAVGYLFWRLRK